MNVKAKVVRLIVVSRRSDATLRARALLGFSEAATCTLDVLQ